MSINARHPKIYINSSTVALMKRNAGHAREDLDASA